MNDFIEMQKIEQYKLYLNLKKKFTERTFLTNRFFLILLIALVIAMAAVNNAYLGYFITFRETLSIIGMCICVLWWSNVDAYNFLIRIRYSNIDEIEKELPFPLHKMEKDKINELMSQKKAFMFADVQKLISVLFFIIFMFVFLYDFIYIVLPKIIVYYAIK